MLEYKIPNSGDWHVGTFIKTTSYQIVEILAGSGLDFSVIDAEHAPFDRTAIDMAVVAGNSFNFPLFVRVKDSSPSEILSALDMGVEGLLIPHVEGADHARKIVSYSKYINGERGYSSSPRAAGYGTVPMKDAIARGDQRIIVAQIESATAVHNAASIAAVDGIDGLFVGRADLALSMGLSDTQHPDVLEATQKVIVDALDAGKFVGMAVGNNQEREKYVKMGVSWFVQSSDQSLLRQAAKSITL